MTIVAPRRRIGDPRRPFRAAWRCSVLCHRVLMRGVGRFISAASVGVPWVVDGPRPLKRDRPCAEDMGATVHGQR